MILQDLASKLIQNIASHIIQIIYLFIHFCVYFFLIPDQAPGRCGRRRQDTLAGHRWAQLWLICDSSRITFPCILDLQATVHTLQIWLAINSMYYL